MYIRKELQEIYIQKYEAYTDMMEINRLVRKGSVIQIFSLVQFCWSSVSYHAGEREQLIYGELTTRFT